MTITETHAVIPMEGPVLVFGGCYSNLEATLALFREMERLRIPPRHAICTGDVVAYCADAAATVDLVRQSGISAVMGNCEESLGSSARDCGCGFAEGSECERLSHGWYAHADAELSAGQRAWMRSLPRRIDILLGGRRLAVTHGAIDSINRFIFSSTPWPEKGRQIELAGCDGVIAGHSGLPFTEINDGKLWHNSGGIGMPANDGTPRVWYSLLLPSTSGIEIRLRQLDYDFASAAGKMRARRLPAGYAAALETGCWPNDQVLPCAEAMRRGQPILETSAFWPCHPQRDAALAIAPKKLPSRAYEMRNSFPSEE